MVTSTLQASVCDEQLMSIGGEIALSGNRRSKKTCNHCGRSKASLTEHHGKSDV